MFRVKVETDKDSDIYVNYYVDERVREILNDILLSQGYIEATSESWKDIQKFHAHRVGVHVPHKTEGNSTDSGIGQSLEGLRVSPEERIKNLERGIGDGLKELAKLKKEIERPVTTTTEMFKSTSFKGLWPKQKDTEKQGFQRSNPWSNSPVTTVNSGDDIWSPNIQRQDVQLVASGRRVPKVVSDASNALSVGDQSKNLDNSKVMLATGTGIQRIHRRQQDEGNGQIPTIAPIG